MHITKILQRAVYLGVLGSLVLGCASTAPKNPPLAICPNIEGPTLVDLKNIKASRISLKGEIGKFQPLDLTDSRVPVVMRVFATWCPFCKVDIQNLNERVVTNSRGKARYVLLAFRNKRETAASVREFVLKGFAEHGVNPADFEVYYTDLDGEGIRELLHKDQPLFPLFRGVPYAWVADKEGQVRVRGNFTFGEQAMLDHYKTIEGILAGSCDN